MLGETSTSQYVLTKHYSRRVKRNSSMPLKKELGLLFDRAQSTMASTTIGQTPTLAKKFLNMFAENITEHDPNPYVICKSRVQSFEKYSRIDLELLQTQFRIKDNVQNTRVIAHTSDTPVAFEINGQFFFLPFFTTKNGKAELMDALQSSVGSVLEYKRKNDIYVPTWLSKIEFKSEARIEWDISEDRRTVGKIK